MKQLPYYTGTKIMDLLFRTSTATDVHGFFPRFRFFLGQYRPRIIYIHILYLFFFLQTYPNKIEKVVKTMSPLLIFMLLSGSLSPVRSSIRESFCHLFFFVRGNGLRVLVYYMHYALRHKWTNQKKYQVRKLHIVSIYI